MNSTFQSFNSSAQDVFGSHAHKSFFIPPLKATLGLTTCALMVFLILLFISQVKYQNDLKSWSVAFYLLCFTWLTFRCAFWMLTIISTETWPELIFYILYWFPNPIEFGDFMILPLFFFQVLYERNWKVYMSWIMTIYIIIVVTLVLCYFLWAIVAAYVESRTFGYGPFVIECIPKHQQNAWIGEKALSGLCMNFGAMSSSFRLLTATCYFLLASSLTILSSQLTKKKNRWIRKRFMIKGPKTLMILNLGLILVFFSRTAYNIGSYFLLWELPQIPLSGDADVRPIHFAVYLAWDFLPGLFSVLIVNGKRRVTPRPKAHRNQNKFNRGKTRSIGIRDELHDFSLFRDINGDALGSSTWDKTGHSSLGSSYYQSSYETENYLSTVPIPRCLSSAQSNVFDDPQRYWRGGTTPEDGTNHSPLNSSPLYITPANKAHPFLPSPIRYPLDRIQQSQLMSHNTDAGGGRFDSASSPLLMTKSIRPRPPHLQQVLNTFTPEVQLNSAQLQRFNSLREPDHLMQSKRNNNTSF